MADPIQGGTKSLGRRNFLKALGVSMTGAGVLGSTIRAQADTGTGTVETVAGGGSRVGPGVPATQAGVRPWGLAAHQATLFIADPEHRRVWKVGPDGILRAAAGTGEAPSGPPEVPTDATVATLAPIAFPTGLALDGAGNLFVADAAAAMVLKVTRQGTISTFAGIGVQGFSGDGGPAALAELNYPNAVAVDGDGNVFIADLRNYRIRKVDPDGGISTVAGTGSPRSNGESGPASALSIGEPTALAIDRAGSVYLSEPRRVRRLDPDGVLSTVAGNGVPKSFYTGEGGPATVAGLGDCYGLTVDAGGALWLSDYNNSQVHSVSPSGVITTPIGTGKRGFSGDGGPARSAQFNRPMGLASDTNGIYVADTSNERVRLVRTA